MERHKNEQTFEQPGMWQAETLARNPDAFDVQKVDVDFARSPTKSWPAAKFTFDVLTDIQ